MFSFRCSGSRAVSGSDQVLKTGSGSEHTLKPGSGSDLISKPGCWSDQNSRIRLNPDPKLWVQWIPKLLRDIQNRMRSQPPVLNSIRGFWVLPGTVEFYKGAPAGTMDSPDVCPWMTDNIREILHDFFATETWRVWFSLRTFDPKPAISIVHVYWTFSR